MDVNKHNSIHFVLQRPISSEYLGTLAFSKELSVGLLGLKEFKFGSVRTLSHLLNLFDLFMTILWFKYIFVLNDVGVVFEKSSDF